MLVTAINKNVVETLNKKRKILNRQGSSDVYSPSNKTTKKQYQQNVVKTPYIVMVSSPEHQINFTAGDKRGEKLKSDSPIEEPYILSNQEYSKSNPKINIGTKLYEARNLNFKDKVKYRPAPGVKSLESEYTSTNYAQFNRKVTINFTCFSLEDLEILTERFMTFNRIVYVQWGWATNEPIEPLINVETGLVNYLDENDPENKKNEIVRLQELVWEKGKGNFDAVRGYVSEFNWTLRDDGGFDCTTTIVTTGVNLLDSSIGETNVTNPELLNNEQRTEVYNSVKSEFQNAIGTLHEKAFKDLNDNGVKQQDIYTGFSTYSSPEEGDTPIVVGENNDKKYQYTFNDIKFESKKYLYDENFIISKRFSSMTANLTAESDTIEGLKFELKDFTDENLGSSRTNQSAYVKASGTGLYSLLSAEGGVGDVNNCWVKWGWFEDNIINKYFALYEDKNDTPVSFFRSVQPTDTNEKVLLGTRQKWKKTGGEKQIIGYIQGEPQYKISKERVVRDGTEEILVKDMESIRVKNDKNYFQTPNIRTFLYPGQFDPRPAQKYNFSIQEKLETNSLGNRKAFVDYVHKTIGQLQYYKLNKEESDELYKDYQKTDEGKAFFDEYRSLLRESKNLSALSKTTLKDLQNDIDANKDLSYKNPSYVSKELAKNRAELLALKEVLDSDIIKPFNARNNESWVNQGFLRNIFINIGYLQEVFKDSGATTLGESLNQLFKQLNNETNGMIRLKVRYDTGTGGYVAEEVDPSHDYEEVLTRIKEAGQLYEFPTWQQDSIVLSQELGTDLSNTQFTAIMSRHLAEEGKNLMSNKNIDQEAQESFNNSIDGDNQKKYDATTNKPAYLKYSDDYGNPRGSDEDVPISQWIDFLGEQKPSVVVKNNNNEYEKRTMKEEADKSAQRKQDQAKKDLETAQKIYNDLPLPYTINGQLKPEILKDMYENMGLEVLETTDTEGNKERKIIIKSSDWGLIGLTTTLQLTGIAGIIPSNGFTTTYLPKKFKANTRAGGHFYVIGSTQSCDASTWTSTIEGRMCWKKFKG
tara:strand:+ start:98 stop:3211 length:3114 start_codon:yes stop_codon:yes gene_type:complete